MWFARFLEASSSMGLPFICCLGQTAELSSLLFPNSLSCWSQLAQTKLKIYLTATEEAPAVRTGFAIQTTVMLSSCSRYSSIPSLGWVSAGLPRY